MKLKLMVTILFAAFAVVPTFGQFTGGINLKVDCSHKLPGTFPSITAALKVLSPAGNNKVTVAGTCNENLLISGFDRLTLITATSAIINDASGGQAPVVDIEDSRRVTLEGFTINGGADGVVCSLASVCYLTGNTIQSSVGQEGVAVIAGSNAILSGNTIQNNSQRALTVANGSRAGSSADTYQGNGDIGVVANSGAYFAAGNSIFQNNGNDGVVVTDHSTARLISCTIRGNAGNGVTLQHNAEARFDSYTGTATVTANGGSGVLVHDLSFGFFSQGANITGNLGGTDVTCAPQYSATRGALTNISGGITNCVEP